MGIKSNYNKFVKDVTKHDTVFNTVHLSEFMFDKIAIDTSIYLYKYKAVFGDKWISGFAKLIKCLRDNSVHCVFVFDGPAPVEKRGEQLKRRESKNKLIEQIALFDQDIAGYRRDGSVGEHLTRLFKDVDGVVAADEIEERMVKKRRQVINILPTDMSDIKELLGVYNVPYYDAPGEAEKYCAKLCMDGKVQAVLSDDTDIIAYGSPVCLSKIDTLNSTVCKLEYTNLLASLEFDKNQHLDHCIMCGTDYNDNVKGIGSHISYKLIKTHGSIENVALQVAAVSNLLPDVGWIRGIFTTFDDISDVSPPYCGKADVNGIRSVMRSKGVFVNDLIMDEYVPVAIIVKII